MQNEKQREDSSREQHPDAAQPKERFQASAPYPPVRADERNPLYGRMMLDNMGGQHSEMSTVSIYLYNNLLIDDDARLSGIFKQVSIVEMHHLHIFGEIARLMGENPRLWTHQGRQMHYWTPAYNTYALELKPMLLNSITREKLTIQKYQNQCAKIHDTYITECLKRIIEDEELHVKLFEALYEEYCS